MVNDFIHIKGAFMNLFEIRSVEYMSIIRYPDIDIKKDITTFICGKSGTGKTTLLNLLNGAKSADKGSITYLGKPIEEYDPIEHRRKVILVNQSIFLFDKTIKENFHEFHAYRDLLPPDDETIKGYLKLCLVDFAIEAECRNMSGGERHRVYLAICISFLPEAIMLDEPTSALDQSNSGELILNIKNFCKEKHISLIIVSHNKELATLYSDDCITLKGVDHNERHS